MGTLGKLDQSGNGPPTLYAGSMGHTMVSYVGGGSMNAGHPERRTIGRPMPATPYDTDATHRILATVGAYIRSLDACSRVPQPLMDALHAKEAAIITLLTS